MTGIPGYEGLQTLSKPCWVPMNSYSDFIHCRNSQGPIPTVIFTSGERLESVESLESTESVMLKYKLQNLSVYIADGM